VVRAIEPNVALELAAGWRSHPHNYSAVTVRHRRGERTVPSLGRSPYDSMLRPLRRLQL